ncbi:MAG: class I fructose-bisphosphate aldolase, partial [Bacteroidales bacterium]
MKAHLDKLKELLGDDLPYLLDHKSKTIEKEQLISPSPDFLDKVFLSSNRKPQVLKSLASIFNHGRLAGTGYLSILPVDQGIEHSGGSAFGPNPIYFDPENIIKLAMEGGCNAVATTMGALAILSRKYAHKIPFIAKINHNELLTYPNKHDQIMFGSAYDAWNLGATAIGATIYFGSEDSNRQIIEVAETFERAHELGMATILWCYARNSEFTKDG